MPRTLKDEWCLIGNDPQDFEELTEEEKERFKMTLKGSSLDDKEYDEFEQNKEDRFTVSMNQDDWQEFQKWKKSKDKAQAGYQHETDRRVTADETREMIAEAVKFPLVKMEQEKPMFFELDNYNLINVRHIIRLHEKTNENILSTQTHVFNLSNKEVERFKRFAKIHGVFGKEM